MVGRIFSNLQDSNGNPRSALLRYGIAITSVALSAAVAYLLSPASQTTPYLFFYGAVLMLLSASRFQG